MLKSARTQISLLSLLEAGNLLTLGVLQFHAVKMGIRTVSVPILKLIHEKPLEQGLVHCKQQRNVCIVNHLYGYTVGLYYGVVSHIEVAA